MTLAARWRYYRRLVPAYLGSGGSQLTFWHDKPAINECAFAKGRAGEPARLGPYYMLFHEKAIYPGPYDNAGIPLLDYRGAIGLQYNPIAIAQWGLANYNRFWETRDQSCREKSLKAGGWLVTNLERNARGLWVWNHHFDWEYRNTLKAPWYSGLAQGQGVSLLLRAHAESCDEKYREAADRAFVALTKTVAEGGVLCEVDVPGQNPAAKDLWIEEYLVDPPTHILNGFIWALWGIFDYSIASGTTDIPAPEGCGADTPVRAPSASINGSTACQIFDRGVQTLIHNLGAYDTGYWSLYEQSGTSLKMLASPFYHRLHIVQLQVMAKVTGNSTFSAFAERWQGYESNRANRTRALLEKSLFKLLYY